ncbi:MAG: DUF1549 domain-containing protein [Pirellulales bacterium]
MNKTAIGAVWILAGLIPSITLAAKPDELTGSRRPEVAPTAAEVNRLLAVEAAASAERLAYRSNDETYLRRVTLDLIGEVPTPEEVTAFVLDPAADKRAKIVDRLLADEEFGQNWARYWRDVILYRRTEDRALLVSSVVESYLTEEFNKGTSWDSLAKSFITASGNISERGDTAIIVAQQGETAETTAEIARIFLGIQVQCANCHDHPTDRWKRKDFHELAAFFPRLELRPIRANGGRRGFEVVSVDNARPNFRGNPNLRRATLEHSMSDLKDPTAEGQQMTPTFFVTGRQAKEGMNDIERRTLLANWITGESDPWFAKAYVNRMWSELVGEGFYEPIDDMGPDRDCSAPQTLDYLAAEFRRSQFDVKWLFRVIAATDVYQRQSRSRRNPDETPFAANCSQRMRADQLYNALTTALGVDDLQGGRRPGRGGRRYGLGGPRSLFNAAFGYDPSEPRDEISASIPQALVMMNAPVINNAINAQRRDTALGKLLADNLTDEQIVVELYLRCLAREPKEDELKTCLSHISETDTRGAALEDILWALLNSTEFLHRK